MTPKIYSNILKIKNRITGIYKFLAIRTSHIFDFLLTIYLSFAKRDLKSELISALTPYDVCDFEKKIRLGRESDGGYIIPFNTLNLIDVVYTYGVSDDVSFEQDFVARRSVPVRLFDHTIDSLPVCNPLFHFKKEGVSNEKAEHFDTYENHLNFFNDNNKRIFLKIDIEGDERKILNKIILSSSKNINLIVLEIHNVGNVFNLLQYLEILRNINGFFTLVHVHGNNSRPAFKIGGKVFPSVIELTFINNTLVKGKKVLDTALPSDLDFPCYKCKKDIVLDYWLV